MTNLSVCGIMPAVITPVDERGRFQPEAFAQLLDRLYAAGVEGAYVCGNTGEGMQQTVAQRKLVAAEAPRRSPAERTVVVHVGAAALEDALELAAHACDIGASAISSLPPPGANSFAEIGLYYQTLAQNSTVPLLVYYFPEAAPALADVESVSELCSLQNVAGVKFTSFNLHGITRLAGEGAVVFNGRDEVLAAGLLMGARGAIGTFYNLVPGLAIELHRHARAGRWEEAMALQRELNALIRVVLRYPLIPAVKEILAWSGIDCRHPLPPRAKLTGEQCANLRKDLDRLNNGLATQLMTR